MIEGEGAGVWDYYYWVRTSTSGEIARNLRRTVPATHSGTRSQAARWIEDRLLDWRSHGYDVGLERLVWVPLPE